MEEFDFTLRFEFHDPNIDPNVYGDALYEAGCDDAMFAVGKKGTIVIDFIRESETAYEAVSSAIKQVKSVIPNSKMDLHLDTTSPDFCYLTGSLIFDKKLKFIDEPIPDKIVELYQYSEEFREMVTYLFDNIVKDYELPSDIMTCAESESWVW